MTETMPLPLAHMPATPQPNTRSKCKCKSKFYVGPNAIIQLGHAIYASLGKDIAHNIFQTAGIAYMLQNPPQKMVDERTVANLYKTFFSMVPMPQAKTIARDAGMRTADYLLKHRIPYFAQILLRYLPASYAARFLLKAIQRNAWTFAGSGDLQVHFGHPCKIEIKQNPIAMPDCVWHAAVFEKLFQTLVTPQASIQHLYCCYAGAQTCCFEIIINPDISVRGVSFRKENTVGKKENTVGK